MSPFNKRVTGAVMSRYLAKQPPFIHINDETPTAVIELAKIPKNSVFECNRSRTAMSTNNNMDEVLLDGVTTRSCLLIPITIHVAGHLKRPSPGKLIVICFVTN